jgi:hypothetical protein
MTTFLIISSYTSIHIGLEFVDQTLISRYFTFLEFVSRLFNSQREIWDIYFYFRNTFDLVPHTHTHTQHTHIHNTHTTHIHCSFANLLRATYWIHKLVSYILH